jgi:hypothetical protein
VADGSLHLPPLRWLGLPDVLEEAPEEEELMVTFVLVVAVVFALGVTIGGIVVDRHDQRKHDEAEPVNRIVGNSVNRIFD